MTLHNFLYRVALSSFLSLLSSTSHIRMSLKCLAAFPYLCYPQYATWGLGFPSTPSSLFSSFFQTRRRIFFFSFYLPLCLRLARRLLATSMEISVSLFWNQTSANSNFFVSSMRNWSTFNAIYEDGYMKIQDLHFFVIFLKKLFFSSRHVLPFLSQMQV